MAIFAPESRNNAFTGGASGTGLNTATSMQQSVPRAFRPDSVLQLPNVIKTDNGMSPMTYAKSMPQEAMLRRTAYGTNGNGTMNV